MSQNKNTDGTDTNNESRVVNFNEIRQQKMDEKRRKTERVFFNQMLGVYCVTGDTKMAAIQLIEVSEEGLSFQVPYNSENPWPQGNGDIPLRLYFSQDTYLPLHVKIQNSRPCIENGTRYVRYGCAIDATISSYQAYVQFVRFMKAYADSSQKDNGDVSVFFL